MNFEEICQQYETWVICISSNLLPNPVFTIWLTDSTDDQHDKFVVNHNNRIIASEDFECLLDELSKVKSNVPDPINTLTWLNKIQGLECSVTACELEVIEQSIHTKTFNKKSIQESINFINLCGDFDEQTDDFEIRRLRKSPALAELWKYGYDEIFWKEFGSKDQVESVRLPKLNIEPEQLNKEMNQLIDAFLNRIEIIKCKSW